MRIYDPEIIKTALLFLNSDTKDEHDAWVNDPSNIVLMDDIGNMALFEIGFKDIYTGHYYFKSRGREAINAAKGFLDEIFNTCYNIDVILGLTPEDNKAARWFSRQVGFKSHGLVEGPKRHYEMFIITKKEFNNG